MADGKIYITISDSRKSGGLDGIKLTDDKGNEAKDNSSALGKYATHHFFNFIEGEAKTMVNYTLGNIGNFTGDYTKQSSINNSLSALNMLKSIATSAVSGFTISGGNPIGAIIGASIAVASMATNYGLQEKTNNLMLARQNYDINLLREKSGLNGTINGGR